MASKPSSYFERNHQHLSEKEVLAYWKQLAPYRKLVADSIKTEMMAITDATKFHYLHNLMKKITGYQICIEEIGKNENED